MITGEVARRAFACTITAATLALATSSGCDGATSHRVTDGVLRITLPSGWSGSVGPGFQVVRGRPRHVAWILAGNFTFRRDAARREGGPQVPPHKLLISVGDFVVTGPSVRWRSVQRLHLPERFRRRRVASWHVRFEGRAVRLEVKFGSNPAEDTRAVVDRVLGSVSRQPS